MISVMKQSYTVLSLKVDRHTLNRVLAVFAAVWRGTRTTVEAMQSEVARSETHWVFRKWELGFSDPIPLRQLLWGTISVQPHLCSNFLLFHTHTNKSWYESSPKMHPSLTKRKISWTPLCTQSDSGKINELNIIQFLFILMEVPLILHNNFPILILRLKNT